MPPATSEPPRPEPTIDPGAARRVGLGVLALLGVGAGAFWLLKGPPTPPPSEIVGNPLLVEGREVFLSRCVSCHGASGRGDGPIAKALPGPPAGDLTDGQWKHGDRPEDVLRVVREGVPNTSMAAWGRILSPRETEAVVAYARFLGGR